MTGTHDEFLTVAEVAEIPKLNQQTIRNWIDSGYLPAIRIGRRIRIARADFDRLGGTPRLFEGRGKQRDDTGTSLLGGRADRPDPFT